MNPNMIQMNQMRMQDIMRESNRQRMGSQARVNRLQARLWRRMAGRIGRGLVNSGEYLLSSSKAPAQNRRTAECRAIELA